MEPNRENYAERLAASNTLHELKMQYAEYYPSIHDAALSHCIDDLQAIVQKMAREFVGPKNELVEKSSEKDDTEMENARRKEKGKDKETEKEKGKEKVGKRYEKARQGVPDDAEVFPITSYRLWQEMVHEQFYDNTFAQLKLSQAHKNNPLRDIMSSMRGKTLSEWGIGPYFHLDGDGASYETAVAMLKKMGMKRSPYKKAIAVCKAFHEINRVISHWHRKQKDKEKRQQEDDEDERAFPVGSDNLMPIRFYVMVTSQIPYLYSEWFYVNSFFHPLPGEENVKGALTHLEAFLESLIDYNPRVPPFPNTK